METTGTVPPRGSVLAFLRRRGPLIALIVVGQLVPAAMLIVGLVKGITANKKVKSEER